MRRLLFLLLPLATLACATALSAAPDGATRRARDELSSAPISVRASRLDLDLDARRATLEGDVTLRRGSLELTCQRLDVRYDGDGQIIWAHARGGVSLREGRASGRARELVLDVAREQLSLEGDIEVVQGGTHMHAQAATIDLATMRVSVRQVQGVVSARAPAAASAPPSATAPPAPAPDAPVP